MVIDFHSHIFPDKIAEKAIPRLASIAKRTPSMNGTIDGLKGSMEKSGVDLSIVLPIVTTPHQFDSILRFASFINETCADGPGPKLFSLASVHPLSDDYKSQLQLIHREGFKGIKVQPNYQGVYFDDIHYMRVIDAASEQGLFVITHTGQDPYTPDEEFCTQDMICHVLDEVQPPQLILAHMGNKDYYDETEKKLCGRPVYFDTAFSVMDMSEEQFVRMVKLHGADKILFGTDTPWTYQKDCIEKINSMTALTEQEKQLIFSENARKILNI